MLPFPKPVLFAIVALVVVCLSFYSKSFSSFDSPSLTVTLPVSTSHDGLESNDPFLDSLERTVGYFESYPLNNSEFGQLGKRLQILQTWITAVERHHQFADVLVPLIERCAQALLPFLPPSSNTSVTPLLDLRNRVDDGARGIIILTGKQTFRYACHLIANIRVALNSNIPIEIAYAGVEDLPLQYRTFITSLSHNITTLNVEPFFITTSIASSEPDGGWAVKPFALLATKLSSVMLLDADAVLFKPPEQLFDSSEFTTTGVSLFHDRLLWPGGFPERHEWWEAHLSHASPLSATTNRSKVILGPYAEEADSGLILLDKSRLGVFMGLLHIAWQNTKMVRESYTYREGYGDKESWWFGFELTGAPYAMEEHYAAIIGQAENIVVPGESHMSADFRNSSETQERAADSEDPERVPEQIPQRRQQICSFQIAHIAPADPSTGRNQTLLWLNGSLLKNKASNLTEFLDWKTNRHWMVDGEWVKNARKIPSCMLEQEPALTESNDLGDVEIQQNLSAGAGVARDVDPAGLEVLRRSVEEAKMVDEELSKEGTGFEDEVIKAWFQAKGSLDENHEAR